MRRQLMFLLVAAAVAAGASACEDDLADGGEEQVPTDEATPAPAGSDEPSAPPTQPPAAGVLASRDVQLNGRDLTIDITGLQRQGQTLTLTFRVTNNADDSFYVGNTFGSGIDFTVSGVTLVDPVNAQRYLVARSGGEDGPCACTQETTFSLDVGDTAEFFANYAAPPPDVTTINVEFPRFGAFTNVAIS